MHDPQPLLHKYFNCRAFLFLADKQTFHVIDLVQGYIFHNMQRSKGRLQLKIHMNKSAKQENT